MSWTQIEFPSRLLHIYQNLSWFIDDFFQNIKFCNPWYSKSRLPIYFLTMTIYNDCIKCIEKQKFYYPAQVVSWMTSSCIVFALELILIYICQRFTPFCHITSMCEYYDVSFCFTRFFLLLHLDKYSMTK